MNYLKFLNKFCVLFKKLNFKFIKAFCKYIFQKKTFFNNASYIIRLDDACETHDSDKWLYLEKIFDKYNIKPIVAVIPKNEDLSLKIDEENLDFWKDVKRWEDKGWSIALHGYQHKYKKVNRKKLFLPFYDKSEFGGIGYKVQEKKIIKAYKIMKKNNINPKLWVAPSHTFDKNTLDILSRRTKIKIISDGIAIYPFKKRNLLFIPQQLWNLKRRWIGIWTVCLHPNTLSFNEIYDFENLVKNSYYLERFTTVEKVINKERKVGPLSYLYRIYFWTKWEVNIFIRSIKKIIN